jgi:membrane protein implicated in regulation of membrane protease activity
MIAFVQSLAWWHWWIAAAALAAIETFIPGAVAIWFGASAFVVGALLLAVPIPWQLQLVIFAVLGITALYTWRRFRPESNHASDQPLLNQRGAKYVGQIFPLFEPLRGGRGKIVVGDTVWLVQGTDAPAGARVRVTGVSGAMLDVEVV